ncbi:MAG TPA: choice-of-anchor tandem repeat GloVer-containing protein [Terriglobia bacterium]|nr:choice-of-anchor tandem repeat GloVer-containing protein [Terriglobia bacterium]
MFKLTPTGAEIVLHSFEGGTSDGSGPFGGVVRDTAGNLYGTTEFGGDMDEGIVFEVGKGKKLTVLHSFGQSTGDGAGPTAGLLRDSAGNLYGTTPNGGAHGSGAIFKVDPTGSETLFFSFPGDGSGGDAPAGGLVEDASGNLYGTTQLGGSFGCQLTDSCGAVFQVSPAGVETVLHSFSGPPSDGEEPLDGLISDSAGNLYGTTRLGGKNSCGIVFSVGE